MSTKKPIPRYYSKEIAMGKKTLKIVLGSQYGGADANNVFYNFPSEIVECNIKHLVEKIGLGNQNVIVTIARHPESGTTSYRVTVDGQGTIAFSIMPYPACCGSSLLHGFSYSHGTVQDGYIERAFMLAWVISISLGQIGTGTIKAVDHVVENAQHRFNAVLVYSPSLKVPGALRMLDTKEEDWKESNWKAASDARYPLFHSFCNKSTVNGRTPFYNVNSGNICETVVVVPKTMQEFLKNASPIK